MSGRFRLVHRDRFRRFVWAMSLWNGVTLEGATYLCGAAFVRASQVGTWYAILIDGTTTPTLSPNDTYTTRPGWMEFSGVAARPVVTFGAVGSGQIATAAPLVFNVTRAGSVIGAGMVSRSPVGDVSSGGVLYSTAVQGTARPVLLGGTVSLTYLIQAQQG